MTKGEAKENRTTKHVQKTNQSSTSSTYSRYRYALDWEVTAVIEDFAGLAMTNVDHGLKGEIHQGSLESKGQWVDSYGGEIKRYEAHIGGWGRGGNILFTMPQRWWAWGLTQKSNGWKRECGSEDLETIQSCFKGVGLLPEMRCTSWWVGQPWTEPGVREQEKKRLHVLVKQLTATWDLLGGIALPCGIFLDIR